MREVDASFKITSHAFMVGKFTAVVIGNGMHPVYVWGESVYDSIPDGLSRFVEDGSDDGIQRFALDQCDQSTPVPLTDHGITLPVTESSLAIDNSRAIINRDLVGNAATPIIRPIALAPELLTTQETVQVAA